MYNLLGGGLEGGSSSSPLLVKSITSEIGLFPFVEDPNGLDGLDGAADKESRVPLVPFLMIGELAFLPPGDSSIKSSSSSE